MKTSIKKQKQILNTAYEKYLSQDENFDALNKTYAEKKNVIKKIITKKETKVSSFSQELITRTLKPDFLIQDFITSFLNVEKLSTKYNI